MQIVSLGDNLHEMSKSTFWENKKKYISECGLLQFLLSMLNINMLMTKFSDSYKKIFFLFFLGNKSSQFMSIISNGDNLHEMSNPIYWNKN